MLKKLLELLGFKKKKQEEAKPEIKMAPPRESIDLEERNKKIREVIGDFESENKKRAEIKPCPHCHMNTSVIVTCKKCGLTGCPECFTYDPSEGAYYCENCW